MILKTVLGILLIVTGIVLIIFPVRRDGKTWKTAYKTIGNALKKAEKDTLQNIIYVDKGE